MLQMGRGPGEAQPTNINTLIEEHARLAYHSARAADPNFNLTLDWDLDPDMVECEVIPQDLGRVFLNMVSNASYATDERRKSLAALSRRRCAALRSHPSPLYQVQAGRHRDPHSRQRERYAARSRREDIQPLLHDQADGQGHRARPFPIQRHYSSAWGKHTSGNRA